MEKDLCNLVNKTPLFTSLPMNIMCNDIIDNDFKAEKALFDIVKTLHSITSEESKLPKFYDVIDKSDLFKLNLFLTERLYCLLKTNEQENIQEIYNKEQETLAQLEAQYKYGDDGFCDGFNK